MHITNTVANARELLQSCTKIDSAKVEESYGALVPGTFMKMIAKFSTSQDNN